MERLGKYSGYMKDEVFLGTKGGTFPPGAKAQKIAPLVKSDQTIKLYPAQQKIFDNVKDWTSALLEARTGEGKTVIACALSEYWGGKTLIIVHSLDMVKQFSDEFEKFLKIKTGKYCTGKKELSKVTITTTRSFVQKYNEFRKFGFNNLIRDEADLEFTEPQRDAITNFPAERKFGMTGTIRSKFDEHAKGSPALCRFYGVHAKMVSKSETPLRKIYFKRYEKKYVDKDGIPFSPQADWINFRKELDSDMDRKIEMVNYILQNTNERDHVLILFDRVFDTEAFARWFKKGRPDINVGMIHGTVAKKLREKRVASFKKNGGILFAQEKVAGRGFNAVKINKCFILFPCKSETNLRQIIGRAIRPYLNKNSFIYTWTDSALQFQHNQRTKTIKEFFPNVLITELKCK